MNEREAMILAEILPEHAYENLTADPETINNLAIRMDVVPERVKQLASKMFMEIRRAQGIGS